MDFNLAYTTIGDQYELEEKRVREQKYHEMVNKFHQMFENVIFDKLQIQKNNYSTDDGCTHYKDISTGQIYSWNFINEEWMQNNNNYQQSLNKKLF